MTRILTHAETFGPCPADDEEGFQSDGTEQLYCPVCGGLLVESIL